MDSAEAVREYERIRAEFTRTERMADRIERLPTAQRDAAVAAVRATTDRIQAELTELRAALAA
jgi:hypothetical protein